MQWRFAFLAFAAVLAFAAIETPERLSYDPYPILMGADFNALPLPPTPPSAAKNQPEVAESVSEK